MIVWTIWGVLINILFMLWCLMIIYKWFQIWLELGLLKGRTKSWFSITIPRIIWSIIQWFIIRRWLSIRVSSHSIVCHKICCRFQLMVWISAMQISILISHSKGLLFWIVFLIYLRQLIIFIKIWGSFLDFL